MSIPTKCTVLIIGGGPSGSYAASVLAREGIDTVLLEAEKHPRYHIGESMIPSFRHYLRFIDLDEEFDKYGFTKKVGAAFRMTPGKEGWSDFLLVGGPNNYTWNVIRSEADELIFRHAGKSGAKTFDGVRVSAIRFDHDSTNPNADPTDDTKPQELGRPVSATYTRKDEGTTGKIKFEYVIDATGRAGIMSTKYLKNRQYSKALKNIAHWAYYTDAGSYGIGTKRANSPFFEALTDESGWAWLIPLHNGTTSVGIVRNQEIGNAHRAKFETVIEYYEDALKLAPVLSDLLHTPSPSTQAEAKRVTTVNTASDYSYSAATYAIPYARIIGDAGCFIDPFFSSGVHLALTGALAAGTTIAASIKGDVSEEMAGEWHSAKFREGYARFLLVVLSTYRQMKNQREAVLSDFEEKDFDRAFDIFRPVIQGDAEATARITQAEFAKTIAFLAKALDPTPLDDLPEEPRQNLQGKWHALGRGDEAEGELEILSALRLGVGTEIFSTGNFTTDVVMGRVPRLVRGELTLVPAEEGKKEEINPKGQE
ncbi:hypothetical protein BDW74DRAFT_188149 [Aspergillus multicolor]|uniref:NAD(P)/FAD-dependent oxidoreductase n=1 Tax=Aspergillus multicolor TaxID=41759 RepID=UPI003CCD779C